jgi:hypothetical protein
MSVGMMLKNAEMKSGKSRHLKHLCYCRYAIVDPTLD